MKVAILGAGNLGLSMAKGLVKSDQVSQLILTILAPTRGWWEFYIFLLVFYSTALSFDDCVEQGGPDCDPKKMWLQVLIA